MTDIHMHRICSNRKKRRDLENPIKYQVFYYPGTDNILELELYKQFGKGYIIEKATTSILYAPIKSNN